MNENSESKLGTLLRWPKKPVRDVPIPSSAPDDETLGVYGATLKQAFEEDLKTVKKRLRKKHTRQQYSLRRKLVLSLAGIAVLGAIAAGVIWNLSDRLDAPDRVIQESEAQRRIIFGPAESVLRDEPKPGDRVIPPRDQWGKTDDKKTSPQERFPQGKKSF